MLSKKIINNMAANYVGAAVGVLAPVLTLPFYLNLLGNVQFGLLSFVLVLLAVLGLIDAGISQALVRYFSLKLGESKRDAAGDLSVLERWYWLFSILLASVVFCFSGLISEYWLNVDQGSRSIANHSVMCAALMFVFYFPGSVYRTILVASERQVVLNAIIVGGVLLRHLLGLVVIYIWPDIRVLLVWYTLAAMLEISIRRHYAWATLGGYSPPGGGDNSTLLAAWKTFAGFSSATWLGAITVQMDRIVLSKMVGIEEFGVYAIAATVGSGVMQLVYPVVQAVLPRLVQVINDPKEVGRINLRLAMGMFSSVLLFFSVFIFFGEYFIGIWLRNAEVASAVYSILTVLLIGSALNAFYNIGYLNWLARGAFKMVLLVNAIALLLAVILLPVFIASNGISGAAVAWVGINLIGFLLSLGWVKRIFHEVRA